MLLREELAHPSITALVVDAVDVQRILGHVIRDGEEMELADQPRRQVLGDERFVLEVAHREIERGLPVGAGELREPLAILGVRRLADAPQVAEHREPQRVRIEPAVGFRIEPRLRDDVGVALQEFEHEAVVDQPLLVQPIEDRVVPERRPAFVHHLGLGLRIEVLGQLAHDAHQLALPGLELRRVFLDEIEDVFLRVGRGTPCAARPFLRPAPPEPCATGR